MTEIPKYWIEFINNQQLRGREIEIPESVDLSNVGACIEIMQEKDCEIEMKDLYPGLVVVKDNFIPVGNCSLGTGDPYFININEGPNGKLYRIYHDEVFDENYDQAQAIDIVLEDYRDLLKYLEE